HHRLPRKYTPPSPFTPFFIRFSSLDGSIEYYPCDHNLVCVKPLLARVSGATYACVGTPISSSGGDICMSNFSGAARWLSSHCSTLRRFRQLRVTLRLCDSVAPASYMPIPATFLFRRLVSSFRLIARSEERRVGKECRLMGWIL